MGQNGSIDTWKDTMKKQAESAKEAAAKFFQKRAAKAKGDGLAKILQRVLNNTPDPGDELNEPTTDDVCR